MEWFELAKLFFSFLFAAVFAYYITPVIRNAAINFGIIDKPDGKLKKHDNAVAYLGGLAVFLPLLFTVSLAYEFTPEALGILLGTTLIIILGLIDDIGVLSPWIKLGGQLVAVWALFKAGISVQIIWLPEWLNLLISLFWIMGVTNAFNLIDVMDGLSTGTALVASVFLAIISFINGNFLIAAFTITLAGSLLGFLPHNFRPASIYLGDTGSMTLGFVLAALTINESYTVGSNWIGVLAPVVIMGIPIFETGFLTVIRLFKGLHPLQGSPDHFSLRLKRKGWSVNRIVFSTYAVGLILGVAGLLLVYGSPQITLITISVVTILLLVITIFLLSEEFASLRKG